MCDHEHYNELRDKVDKIEDEMNIHHAQSEERFKTLFSTCEKLSDTATTVLKIALTLIGFVVIVAVLALVYGALGHDGFNAVSSAAQKVETR